MSLEACFSLEKIRVLKSGVFPTLFIYEDHTKLFFNWTEEEANKRRLLPVRTVSCLFQPALNIQNIILDELCLFVLRVRLSTLVWRVNRFLSSVLFFPPSCPVHTYISSKAVSPQILCHHGHHKVIGFDACTLQEAFYRLGNLFAKYLTSYYLTNLIGSSF